MNRMPAFLAIALALFGVLLAGCGTAAADDPEVQMHPELLEVSPSAGAKNPEAQMHPELLQVSASPANPGQTIKVRFPEETFRGIAWALEEQDGNSWNVRYYLIATTDGDGSSGSPSWWPANDPKGQTWEDIGVGGPGPDTLIIPDSIRPGTYRLCTANSMPNICTMLDITE
jgi:hypothetical protein